MRPAGRHVTGNTSSRDEAASGRSTIVALSCTTGMIGVAVLLGWTFDVGVLKSILPGLTTMKANTAIGFDLAAVSLLAIAKQHTRLRLLAATTAILLAILGLATLGEYLFHQSLDIDELLFADPATTSGPFNGRMSPATASSFAALGIGLAILATGANRRALAFAHLLCALPAAIGFLALAGYAFGVERFYNFGPFVAVALHTGAGLILLSGATLLTRQSESWGSPFVSRPVARRALSQIGSLAIVIPAVTGFLVVRGLRAGYYEAQVIPALFAVAAAGSLLWLALRAARILARAEGELHEARMALATKEHALLQGAERHRALAERLPQLIWTALPNGDADYFSPQWVTYTGIPEIEQVGQGWLERVVHPDDVARTRDHWAGAVAGAHPYDIDYRIRGASGEYRWFKVRGTAIKADGGGTAYWFGTGTDIEDAVRAREVLATSRRDLEAQVQARTAELMAVEAQLRQSQKMEAVGQLTGGVAHDFNNLLTIIRSASDLLRRPGMADDRRRRYLDAISDTADRAARLTGQLLAFSRRQALKPETFDAAQRVSSIVEMLRSLVGTGVAVVLEPVCAPCYMEADASQFETALVNMVVNARDAMAGDGTLTITIEDAVEIPPRRGHEPLEGRFVAVSISDTGPGIPVASIEQIFEPFFTTKEVGKGTGLGLSQVFGFAKQSMGDIVVASAPGEGATFTLYLPHAAPPVRTVEGIVPDRRASPGDGRGHSILVVEDNQEVGAFSTQLLEDLGYVVVWCTDGHEALRTLADGGTFDAVFSDVMMPGMSGIELGQEVRRLYPGLPVILTSGYSDILAQEGRHGFELLSKPYAVEDLSRLLRRAVNRAPG